MRTCPFSRGAGVLMILRAVNLTLKGRYGFILICSARRVVAQPR
jgi:hypothetical protein